MEKRRPSHDLLAIKAAIGTEHTLAITPTAFRSALALGFSRRDVAGIIAVMDRRMFYKSMTTHADHRIWQDVYHVPVDNLLLYIKFQSDAVTEFRVMSFKER